MKKLSCSLILLPLFLLLAASIASAQSYFKGDTLNVQIRQLGPDAFDSMGYSFNPTLLKHSLKVSYEDKPAFAAKDFDDSLWPVDSSRIIENKNALKTNWYRFKLHIDSTLAGRPFMMIFEADGALELHIDGKLNTTLGHIPSKGQAGDLLHLFFCWCFAF